MRKRFAALALALLLVIVVWLASRSERPRETKAVTATARGDGRRDELPLVRGPAEARPSEEKPVTTQAHSPASLSSPSTSPAPINREALIEADKVNLMIRDYRTMAGENPVGTNAEIMSAVMGKNPKHAKLGPPEGMKLNEKGELIDRWGTPYFFHQLSRDHIEIRSAGPDKVMWTDDDPVIR